MEEMNRLSPGLLTVGDYIDRLNHITQPADGLSTAERMEDLLAQLAREAASEATPANAERYAASIMFVRTGLESIRRLRGGK